MLHGMYLPYCTKIWEFVGVSGKNQWMNEETASDSFL